MTRSTRLALLAAALIAARLAVYALVAIGHGGLQAAICQYDCTWYVNIATDGYAAHTNDGLGPLPNFVFFPLFPILIRVVTLTGPGAIAAGLIVANLMLLAMVLLGAAWLRRSRPDADPTWWVLFVLLFPFGFVFSVPYTESLFMALLLGALLAIGRRRLMLAGCLVALMMATRPNGVVALPLLVIAAGRELWSAWPRARHGASGDDLLGQRLAALGDAALPLSIAPLGLAMYMVFQYWFLGDALAFSHIQILWDRYWTGPWHQLSHAFAAFDLDRLITADKRESENYNGAWVLLGLGLAVWLGRQRRLTEAYVLAMTVLLPVSTGIHSLPRFIATCPFLVIALFDLFRRIDSRGVRVAILALFAMSQPIVIYGWYHSFNALF